MEEDKKPEKPRTTTNETSFEVRGNTTSVDTIVKSESGLPKPRGKQ